MATLNLREFDPKKQHYPFGGLELRASEQKKHIWYRATTTMMLFLSKERDLFLSDIFL